MDMKELEDIAANLIFENRQDTKKAKKLFEQNYPNSTNIFDRVMREMNKAVRSYP